MDSLIFLTLKLGCESASRIGMGSLSRHASGARLVAVLVAVARDLGAGSYYLRPSTYYHMRLPTTKHCFTPNPA